MKENFSPTKIRIQTIELINIKIVIKERPQKTKKAKSIAANVAGTIHMKTVAVGNNTLN